MNNPSVNRYLEDKAMDHIDHALGRPVDPFGETFRNCFVASGRLADEIAASGYWEEFARSGEMRFFSVTDDGRAALSSYLEEISEPHMKFAVIFDGHTSIIAATSAAKARYQQWLEINDIRCDLTFGEFCRKSQVRRAA